MLAVEPAIYGICSIIAVIVAAATSLYQVVINRRHNERSDDVASTTIVVEGLRGLMTELRTKNVELEHDITELRAKVRLYRQEAQEANTHAARCERSLADAMRRIAELERVQ